MDTDRDASNTDECLVTALQIFEYCGAESTGTLHVDVLLDKCAPSVKSNDTDFNYLKSLLDPNQSNPEINVATLASALNMFSDGLKSKLDLDESFNLKNGSGPLDSDSGISNDGYQILEELQSELREKSHLASKLRSQLDFIDRQHEEALAAVTAERDSLKAQLAFAREESAALGGARRDREEACERLRAGEQALAAARRDHHAAARRAAALQQRLADHDDEKLTLQELLTKSKEECHRINEMYASRQASLIEQGEALRAKLAALQARLLDQEELAQQALRDKVVLEMELKEMLNRSNQTQLRRARSVDVSYTEEQMLSALDSLNAERFSPGNQVLDEEAFVKQLKEQDIGRASNLSLFDEIRLSFCNVSRRDLPDSFCNLSKSQILELDDTQLDLSTAAIGTQTDTETEQLECSDIKCVECDKLKDKVAKLQFDLKLANNNVELLQANQTRYEENLNVMQNCVEIFDVDTNVFGAQTDEQPVQKCNDCVGKTLACDKQKDRNFKMSIDLRKSRLTISSMETELSKYQTKLKSLQEHIEGLQVEKSAIGTQTDAPIETVASLNNNNVEICEDCTKQCLECEKLKDYATKLEHDVSNASNQVYQMHTELDKYENTLDVLQKYVEEGIDRNKFLHAVSDDLQNKLEILEAACQAQKDKIESLTCELCTADCQTDECDVASVSTQVEVPCLDCEQRNAVVPRRNLRRLLWEPLKCLFQAFAVLCFICAISVLYGVTRRTRCDREAVPWRWLDAQEFMDMLLRIEYVADVPM